MISAREPRIKSAERTLALLELFSREQRPMTVGGVASSLRIPQPSASMLLRNLEALGYLEHDHKARTYAPSIRVALLGAWIDRRFNSAGGIRHELDELQRAGGDVAYIAIQNGSTAQYVLSQEAGRPEHLMVASGAHMCLTFSAAGRALLALRPDAEIRAWVRRCNAEVKEDHFIVGEKAFLELIEDIRVCGYAETIGASPRMPGHGAIAMSFRAPMGKAPLAVGVGGPIPEIRERKDLILASLRKFKAVFEVT
jgi:DNA-binding IclR family transcriptional regulator